MVSLQAMKEKALLQEIESDQTFADKCAAKTKEHSFEQMEVTYLFRTPITLTTLTH